MVVDSGQDLSCTGIIKDTPLVIHAARSPGSNGTVYGVHGGSVQLGDLNEGEMIVVDLTFDNPPENFDQISLGCLLGSIEERE